MINLHKDSLLVRSFGDVVRKKRVLVSCSDNHAYLVTRLEDDPSLLEDVLDFG